MVQVASTVVKKGSSEAIMQAEMTLTRLWGGGEEKFGTIGPGGFYGQIATDLYEGIQATSRSFICAPVEKVKHK